MRLTRHALSAPWLWGCAGLVGTALVQALYVVRFGVNLPLWDEWEMLALFRHQQAGTLSFQELFSQHTDHRLLIVRLIHLGLRSLIGEWNLIAEMLLSALLVGATAGVLAYTLSRLRITPAATVLTCAILTSPVQWDNILWGLQMQFYLLVLLNVLVVSAIALADAVTWPLATAVAVACMLSTYTMGSGMFSWGVAAVCLATRFLGTAGSRDRSPKWSWPPLILLAAAALLSTVAYLIGYREVFVDLKPKTIGVFFWWVARALGYPLLETATAAGVVLAVGQWAVIGAALARLYRARHDPLARARLTLMLGSATFLVANVVITGYRRSAYIADSPGAEILSRYTTIFIWNTILLVWASAELSAAIRLDRGWRSWCACAGLVGIAAGVSVAQFPRHVAGVATMARLKGERLGQAATVVDYLSDPDPGRKLKGPAPMFERRLRRLLDDQGLVAQLPSWLGAAASRRPATTTTTTEEAGADDSGAPDQLMEQPRQTGRAQRWIEALVDKHGYSPPARYAFEVTASSPAPQTMQLFYLREGRSQFDQAESATVPLDSTKAKRYRFEVPVGRYTAFRFDPMMQGGRAAFRDAAIVDISTNRPVFVLPVEQWRSTHDIASAVVAKGTLRIRVLPGAVDPHIIIDLPSLPLILAAESGPSSIARLVRFVVLLALLSCIAWLCMPTGAWGLLLKSVAGTAVR